MIFSSSYTHTNGTRVAVLALLILVLAVHGWAKCGVGSGYIDSPGSACTDGTVNDPCKPQYVDCVKATGSVLGKLVECVSTGKEIVNGRCHFNRSFLCCTDTTSCERDSSQCVFQGKTWLPSSDPSSCGICQEQCDSTYHCQSVYTENLVIRSEITLTNCHGTVLSQRYVLGSCVENGFCEGEQGTANDSCTYNQPDPNKCKSGGQNGSLCTYVCPDGQLHSCRIAWDPGAPASAQPCPKTPPSDCTSPRSSSSSGDDNPPVDSLPDYPFSSSESGGGTPPDSGGSGSDCPECDILEEILDTLHRANEQRRFSNYVLDSIKQDVGGFGASFDVIASNTRVGANAATQSRGILQSIDNKISSLDLDNIKATVDSVVVHVDVSGSDTVPYYFFDLDSLPVWRDTVSELHRSVDDVRASLDSLNGDTTGIIGKYLPFLKKMSDRLDDLTGDCDGMECLYRPVIDTLVVKMRDQLGLDTVTSAEESAVSRGIIEIGDSAYIDGEYYCIKHPESELCFDVPQDTLDKYVIPPPDSAAINDFMKEQDSLLMHYDSIAKDTSRNKDSVGLKELAGDSATIRNKLDSLFIPVQTVESCFEFRMQTSLHGWAVNLIIDFANLFGLDLCDLIRKIVRLVTFIMIMITTIRGYIRAFGGGGSGGGSSD